ncbi:MAG: coenzyme F420-0:L-glutamate ligase, partial [Ornithinimicrobium sp.]
MTPVQIFGLGGIPEVQERHDLAELIAASLRRAGLRLSQGDVLVISSKVISKAQGLRAPSDQPRQDVVDAHTVRVVAERLTPGGMTKIVESAAGPVMAAAGVDDSNTGPGGGSLVLPSDPDLAARSLYAALLTAYAPTPLPLIGIVISDTAGRPWRQGQTDFAVGACGVQVLVDLKGYPDTDGRLMMVT